MATLVALHAYLNVLILQLRTKDHEGRVQQLSYLHLLGTFGRPVKTQVMVRNLRDAAQLIFRLQSIARSFFQIPRTTHQKEKVGDGGKRMVNVVHDTGRQTPRYGPVLASSQF